MSSLASLKKDIDESTQELYLEVKKFVEMEDSLLEQGHKVDILKKHVNKLQRALSILEGTESESPGHTTEAPQTPPSSGPAESPVTPPTKPTGPRCSACEGRMIPVVTRAPSGVLIQHLKCEDCSNEAF